MPKTEIDQRPPEEFTKEEWLERFHRMMHEIQAMNIQSDDNIDWSREKIHEDRGL